MGIGAMASLYFLFKYKPFVLDWNATPLILIYCLPVWVLIHYCFFAQEPDLQWLEIKSLWVRVVAGMLIATAMGLLIRKPDRINSVFIFAFFGMSIAIVSVYIFNSIDLGRLITPTEFLIDYLFDRNKVGTAFFSAVDLAVGCASINYIFSNDNSKSTALKSLGMFFFMAVSIGASIVARSKNGVGIGVILITFFIVTIFIIMLKNKNSKNFLLGFFIVGITALIIGSTIYLHKNTTSPGWETVFADIQIAVDIDKYDAWKGVNPSTEQPWPKNSLGTVVAANTYLRFAFISAGFREIIRHPLGYGTINNAAFPRLLKIDGITFDGQGSTHSGWIDLALAFGFPSILIVFSSMALTLLFSLQVGSKSFVLYLTRWIILAVYLAGFFMEITYKHTFEAAIFFITLCAAFSTSVKKHIE